ncbi:MAG TPA: caspase family protein, partial [Thermoanaerobaculia bacterium]|nr:caspase family protein [Thermoanaerobaculia bacterium]
RRRALLVGISDYSASRLARPADAKSTASQPAGGRAWPNLGGPVNDVEIMREMLILLYGFAPQDIITLTDQRATRASILKALAEQLVEPAGKGDIVLFYFAGHGSQVKNSRSDEPDHLDESLVPADSRLGARDIRDKELRRPFNRILDQGARLTVILDNCHSASGARGLATGAYPRGVKPDLRDIAESSNFGPRPEDRGALVLAAAQDFDFAWETRDEQGKLYGAFSWAWARAMRDAATGEPAQDTFLRAQARLRAETPFQEPVLAGNAEARLSPFLGARKDRRADRALIAIEKLAADGTLVLQGGWANGLTVGSELRLADQGETSARLEVTALRGLGRCEARLKTPVRSVPAALKSGALLEIVGWAAPPGKPLRVWMPRVAGTAEAAAGLARELAREAPRRKVKWVDDPTETTPTHLLRWRDRQWEVLAPGGEAERLGPAAQAVSVLEKVPAGASLFVQIPAPLALVEGIAVGPRSDHPGVQSAAVPEEADYVLVGRLSGGGIEYAWLRPGVEKADQRRTGLPLRTDWQPLASRKELSAPFREAALILKDAVLRLRKIHGWHHLDSPPAALSVYQLAIRRARDGAPVEDGILAGSEEYGLALRARSTPLPPQLQPRYFYAFTIDSHGKSVLLFPTNGSVENRFPLSKVDGQTPPDPPIEIPLDPPALFEVTEPYGIDTYFLLSTGEPLPNPWVVEGEGVHTRGRQTPLEELLALTGSATRSAGRIVTPATWSIERMLFRSVPPGEKGAR